MENTKNLAKVKRTIILCMFAFFAVFAIAVFSFVQIGNLKRKNARTDKFILALQNEEQTLQSNLDASKDDGYVDTVARDDLDMIKDFETIYYFE